MATISGLAVNHKTFIVILASGLCLHNPKIANFTVRKANAILNSNFLLSRKSCMCGKINPGLLLLRYPWSPKGLSMCT